MSIRERKLEKNSVHSQPKTRKSVSFFLLLFPFFVFSFFPSFLFFLPFLFFPFPPLFPSFFGHRVRNSDKILPELQIRPCLQFFEVLGHQESFCRKGHLVDPALYVYIGRSQMAFDTFQSRDLRTKARFVYAFAEIMSNFAFLCIRGRCGKRREIFEPMDWCNRI